MFTGAPGRVAFRTCGDARYARAARLRALPAWEMHLQVQNRTQTDGSGAMLNLE